MLEKYSPDMGGGLSPEALGETDIVSAIKLLARSALECSRDDTPRSSLHSGLALSVPRLEAFRAASSPEPGTAPSPASLVRYELMKSGSMSVPRAAAVLHAMRWAAWEEMRFEYGRADGRRASQTQCDKLYNWQSSGLETTRGMPPGAITGDLSAFDPYDSFNVLNISPDSVLRAFESGGILHLFPDARPVRRFLRQYGQEIMGIAMPDPTPEQSGAVRLAAPPDHTPTGQPYTEFVNQCMESTRDQAFLGRHLKGPHYGTLVSGLQALDEKLKDISPDLSGRHLHATAYRDPDVVASTPHANTLEGLQLYHLYHTKRHYFDDLACQSEASDAAIVLSPGDLLRPPYIRSDASHDCVSTCFRMIFAGITGETINADEMSFAMKRVYGTDKIHQEDVLKILRSQPFTETYGGHRLECLTFTGMSLARIKTIRDSLIAKDPAYGMFAVLNTGSRSSADPNVWHAVVLTSTNEETVRFHDPAVNRTIGGADRVLSKRRFADLWALAYNSGYLVITSPSAQSG